VKQRVSLLHHNGAAMILFAPLYIVFALHVGAGICAPGPSYSYLEYMDLPANYFM
jgi:hypothetical protein